MPRSSGRVLAIGALLAGSAQLAFVTPSLPTSSRSLRSRVSLAASQAEVDAAKQTFDLQKWAADKLATEGSPAAAAAAGRAQQAEAAYMALKAELDGQPAPVAAAPAPVAAAPVAAAPVAAAPVAAAPVAAPVAAGGASKEEIDAAKKQADLLTWAADKLASEGSPMAAAAATRAQQAEAAYLALKDGQAAPAVAAAPAVSAPVAAAPVAAAPVAAAPVAVSGGVTKEELDAAKKQADLFTWAANKLASEGAPQAAEMKAKAEQAVAELAAKQAVFDGQPAPAAPAPVAAAPVAAAPVAAAPVPAAPVPAAPAVSGAPSAEEVSKAKATAELHAWAADQLVAKGDAGAAAMQAKAAQSLAAYEALKAAQDKVMAR